MPHTIQFLSLLRFFAHPWEALSKGSAVNIGAEVSWGHPAPLCSPQGLSPTPQTLLFQVLIFPKINGPQEEGPREMLPLPLPNSPFLAFPFVILTPHT